MMWVKRFMLPQAALFLASPSWAVDPLVARSKRAGWHPNYKLGRGVERDFHQAFRLYCLVATQGIGSEL